MTINQKVISHGAQRVPWLTLTLTALMISLYYFLGNGFESLLFVKTAINYGQLWRILTGHVIHYNLDHLFWNLFAFLVLAGSIEMHSRKHLIPSMLFSFLGVSLWLFFFEKTATTYCGLSGALNGLLITAAILQWKSSKSVLPLLIILGTLGKIVFEFTTNQTIFTNLSSHAIPSAHAAGFVTGLIYYYLFMKNKNTHDELQIPKNK